MFCIGFQLSPFSLTISLIFLAAFSYFIPDQAKSLLKDNFFHSKICVIISLTKTYFAWISYKDGYIAAKLKGLVLLSDAG